ncbi:MAG: hypothetical protein ACK4Q5_20835, partial [Saprospiraceae bacterium]
MGRKKQEESVLVTGCEADSVLYRSSLSGKYAGLEIQVFEPQEPHPSGVEGKNDPVVGRLKITRAPNKSPYHEIFSHFLNQDFPNAETAMGVMNEWKRKHYK